MTKNVRCPHCSAWSAADLPWCRECGGSLRTPGDVAAPGASPPAAGSAGAVGPSTEPRRSRLSERERELLERKETYRKEWEELDQSAKRQESAIERTSRRIERGKELQGIESFVTAGEALLEEVAEAEPTAPVVPKVPRGKELVSPRGAERAAPELRGDGMPRIQTHIAGLDQALGGGIPRGYVVIVEGAPGTMKSSLAFWVLARDGVDDGRRGLYVTCEESSGSLLRQMGALGLDLEAAAPHVRILDAAMLGRKLAKPKTDWLKALRSTVESVRKDHPFDLLVIDSLEALSVMARFADRRQELFRLFEWLRDLGLTTFVIAERPDYVVHGNVLQGRYDENFLADGVLTLRLHMISDLDVQRRIRIVKMRGTKHETGYLALHVGDGELQVGRILGV